MKQLAPPKFFKIKVYFCTFSSQIVFISKKHFSYNLFWSLSLFNIEYSKG